MDKTRIIMAVLVAASFIVSFYAYPMLPETVASHWNSAGEVDGYMNKDFMVFLMPAISLLLFGLFLVIPRIDPLKKNLEKFINYFNLFFISIIAFMLYIHIITLGWNFGVNFNMSYAITPAISLLFYFIAIMMEKSERNWFIGIRTPWTLSSDRVWKKTHALGAKVFKLMAVVLLLTMLFGKGTMFYAVMVMLAAVLGIVVYSYLEYRKETEGRI